MIKHALVLFFTFLIALTSDATTGCGQVIYGNRRAPLKMTEYASPTCVICSQFSETIFPELHRDYIKTGKAMLTVINLPFNAIDLKACVLVSHSPNPQKFNTFVYQHQKEWLFSKDPLKQLGVLLEKQAMSHKQIKKALKNREIEDRIIKQRLIEEQKQNIQAIPLIIIGQKRIVGLMPWDKLKLVIEEALQHIKRGNPLETFGQNDENKKDTRTTSAPKKRDRA